MLIICTKRFFISPVIPSKHLLHSGFWISLISIGYRVPQITVDARFLPSYPFWKKCDYFTVTTDVDWRIYPSRKELFQGFFELVYFHVCSHICFHENYSCCYICKRKQLHFSNFFFDILWADGLKLIPAASKALVEFLVKYKKVVFPSLINKLATSLSLSQEPFVHFCFFQPYQVKYSLKKCISSNKRL